MRLARLIAGVVGIALLLAACDFHGPYHVPWTKEKYKRWEAPGRYGGFYGPQNVYWLDDDRVLYVGTDEDDPNYTKRSLRVWTLSSGTVEVLGPAIGELCYFRGYVKYWESESGLTIVEKEGMLGTTLNAFSDARARESENFDRGHRMHSINCRRYNISDFAPGGNCKQPLLPGDGYLEFQGGRCEPEMEVRIQSLVTQLKDWSTHRAASDELTRIDLELARHPVRYFPEGRPPIALPIEANEFWSGRPVHQFVEWRKQYLMPQRSAKGGSTVVQADWPKDEDYIAYMLSPGGTLETISLPITRHFFKPPHRIAFTRSGIVAMTPGLSRDRRTFVLGLIFYVQQQPFILDDGVTEEMTLAPNGCRIAYSRRTGTSTKSDPWTKRLRVIDLCARSD